MQRKPSAELAFRNLLKRQGNILASEYMATPVLDERQWEIDLLLRKRLSTDKWTIFVGVGLSAFFDPELQRAGGSQYRDLMYRASALFVIATGVPEAVAKFMVIESGQPQLEKFLDFANVAWTRYPPLLETEEFVEQITAAIAAGSRANIGERCKVNRSEHQAARELMSGTLIEYDRHLNDDTSLAARRDWAQDTPRLLHEVALHRLRPKRLVQLSPRAEHILQTSSLDFLLHSRGVRNQPLFAIEIDGGVHTDPMQMRKDRAKDEVMRALGIPLCRITPADADYWRRIDSQSHESRQRLMRFSRLISAVAISVFYQGLTQAQDMLSVDLADKAIHRMQEKLARSIFGVDFVDLVGIQRSVVRETCLGSAEFQEADMAWRIADHHIGRQIDEAAADRRWPNDLLTVSTQPQFVGNLASGMTAQTTLTMVGSPAETISAPAIRFVADRLEPRLMSVSMEVNLIRSLEEIVRVRIRAATPPQQQSSQRPLKS